MAKHKKNPEHDNTERWLVSYADFITLLFAFFAVLYATSSKNFEKEKKFQESIKKYFAVLGVMGTNQNKLNTGLEGSIIESPIPSFPPSDAGPEEVKDFVKRQLQGGLPANQYQETVTKLKHDAVGVRIGLAAQTFFPMGSAALKAEAYKVLDKVGEILILCQNKIIIEGHTDNVPIQTDMYPSNWELSAARATKIVRYFISRFKIDPSRLIPVAYADQKPLAKNDTETNREKNRRIEILIVTDQEWSM